MTTGLGAPWRRWEELCHQAEDSSERARVGDLLEMIALGMAIFLPPSFAVCALFTLLLGYGVSELAAGTALFLGLLGVALVLYGLAVLVGRLQGVPSGEGAHTGRTSVRADAGGTGGEHVARHRDQLDVARVCIAGMFAVQGTTAGLVGLWVWPLWASVGVGSGFLALAYLLQPGGIVKARTRRHTRVTGTHGRHLTGASPQGGPRARPRSGDRGIPDRYVRIALFVVLFHAGLLANVGVVVALAGGPPWALAGGFIGPPLIVASFVVAPEGGS